MQINHAASYYRILVSFCFVCICQSQEILVFEHMTMCVNWCLYMHILSIPFWVSCCPISLALFLFPIVFYGAFQPQQLLQPLRARVTVVVLCVCLSVCVSVSALAASASVETSKQRYSRVSLRLLIGGYSEKTSVQKLWREKAYMQMS